MPLTLQNPKVINRNPPWIRSYASISIIQSEYINLPIVLLNRSGHIGSHEPRMKVAHP